MELHDSTDSASAGQAKLDDAKSDGIVAEDTPELDEAAQEAEREKLRREREARAQALTLEIVGDLPYAEVKPPENVLFVCKLNPVTEDEDLHTIFSRFGTIVSCEVIRDKRTGDSLQYAFIEYEQQKDCEQAYTKMSGVLIDDHRIHVDFSQSVSRLSDSWRNKTNTRRREQAGGFGGVAGLEKKRQYRKVDPSDYERRENERYRMVFDKKNPSHESKAEEEAKQQFSRSRSPDPYQNRRGLRSPRQSLRERSREHSRNRVSRRNEEEADGYVSRPRSRERDRHRGEKGRNSGQGERYSQDRRHDRRRPNEHQDEDYHDHRRRR